jgi:outer membrane protein TolC
MRQAIKNYAVLMIIGCMALGAQAQEETTSFNLDQAIAYAMTNSYVLKNTSKDIQLSQEKVWETITTGLPQVTGSFDYSKNILAAKSPFPVGIIPKEFWPDLGIPEDTPPDGTIPLSFMQKYNSGFDFSVTQQIFDGLWIVGVSSAQLYVDLSRQMHEKTEIDIREAVTQAYYTVLISQRYKIVLQENYDNTKELLDETKIYLENGFREQQDVDQLQILLKNAENEMIRADRELAVAKIVLKYAMGYDLDTDILLVDDLNVFVLPLVQETNQFELDFSNHIDYRLANSNFQV